MWRLKACLRLILPEPVTLKRLDAPELGFTFGIVDFILQFGGAKVINLLRKTKLL
jgi:hypothetical protein